MNQRYLLIARVIWAAMTLTPLVFLFILKQMIDQPVFASTDMSSSADTFYIFGFVAALISWFLPKILMVKKDQLFKPNTVDRDLQYVIFLLVRLITAEQVALIGLAVAMQKGDLSVYYPFMVVTYALFMVSLPNEEKMKQMRL